MATGMSERRSLAARLAPLALFPVTYVTAAISIATTTYDGDVAAFWLVNGIALISLLRLRPRQYARVAAWAAIAAGMFLANTVCGNGVISSAWFTLGNLTEIGFAYAIFRVRLGNFSIERGFTSMLPHLVIASLAAPACGALLVSTALSAQMGMNAGDVWRQWWLPDVLGMLIAVPLGLFVSRDDLRRLKEPHSVWRLSVGALVLAAIITMILTTGLLAPMLLIAPLMMMAAVRFRALGAAITIGVAAWCIIPSVGGESTLSNSVVPEGAHRVIMVQAFLALSGLLALGVSALLDERDGLARALDARRRIAADAAQSRLRLLMNVAHEIRTPLNVIQGCGEMAVSAGPLNARQHDLLEAVTAASRQLQLLASDLLESARLEHAAIALNPERILPQRLVDAAIADVRASVPWNGAIVFSNGCATIWADPQRFRQVATNLISNAAKFGGAYGPVRVSLKEMGDTFLLSVSDCGPGFPPGREHEIFEPFAASSGQVTPASAGVGLSLVKQLVEAHGGKVRCVSAPYLETRIEAEFPAEHVARAVARDPREDLRSVDPDTVF